VTLVVEALLLARERGDAYVELLDASLGMREGRPPLEHDVGTSDGHLARVRVRVGVRVGVRARVRVIGRR